MDWTTTKSFPEQPEKPSIPQGDESIPIKLAQINRERFQLAELEGKLLEKGLASYNPDILIKAQLHWNDIQQRESSNFKSTIIDPQHFSDSLGYKEKRQSLSNELLRRMSRTPMVRAVIGTRQSQVSAFNRPQTDRFSTGFVIRKKREYYSTEDPKVTTQDKQEIKRLTDFLLRGGLQNSKWSADNFDNFLKKVVDDSLSLDQATFEVVRNNFGEPAQYLATDGATMRIAASYDDDAYSVNDVQKKFGYYPSYVQIVEGEVVNEYYPWELCFGVRNCSTDIYRNGYGRSELEDLVEIVTYMLHSDTYNGKFFTQGSNPKGILKISGNMNTNRLAEFRQQWQSMVAGTMNAHKIPVIESGEAEWIDLQKNNTDMQFATWQEYLLKVVCAMYKIAPEEIGFNVGNAGGGGGMFDSGTEARLMYSRDKGLIPLLKNIEFWINQWIIEPLNEDFEFAFVGYKEDAKKDELDMDIKMVSNFVGYKEMRRKWGYKDDFEEGDFPLSSAWIQRTGALEMQQQQQDNTQAAEGMDQEQGTQDIWDSLDKGYTSENPMTNDLLKFWNEQVLQTV